MNEGFDSDRNDRYGGGAGAQNNFGGDDNMTKEQYRSAQAQIMKGYHIFFSEIS